MVGPVVSWGAGVKLDSKLNMHEIELKVSVKLYPSFKFILGAEDIWNSEIFRLDTHIYLYGKCLKPCCSPHQCIRPARRRTRAPIVYEMILTVRGTELD